MSLIMHSQLDILIIAQLSLVQEIYEGCPKSFRPNI